MNLELDKLVTYSLEINEETLSILDMHTEIALIIDEFEDKKTIKFLNVGYEKIPESALAKYESPYFKMYKPEGSSAYEYFGMTLINYNGYSYLEIATKSSEISLASGDYFVILFEDGYKEKYEFKNAASKNELFSSNIISLKTSDLINFLTKKLDKVKLVSARKNIYSIYSLNEKNTNSQYFKYQYATKEMGQDLLKFMTYKFIDFNIKNKI